MANYLIGDIQGCFDELQLLLEQVCFDPKKDVLWLAGDLVARGKGSLEVLRFAYQYQSNIRMVLGNHDLHLLAVAEGIRPYHPQDHTLPILNAPDKDKLLSWLRHQPLLQEHDDFVMAHAGISPLWDLTQARQAANQVEQLLQGEHWQTLLSDMYTNEPKLWTPNLTPLEQLRYTINSFTRMRYCTLDGGLDMHCKLPPNKLNSDQTQQEQLIPWFKLPQRKVLGKPLIFGHWAALEGYKSLDVIGLDTGCVWGGYLTLLDWERQEYHQQPALKAYQEPN